MDCWISSHLGKPYDENGQWSATGTLVDELLRSMLSDPYFSKKPPKSTGREYFDCAWVKKHIAITRCEKYRPTDIQRTLLELTATTIAKEVKRHRCDSLYLCGGGSENAFLKKRIKALLPQTDVSVMPEASYLEAMMSAWLAYMRIHNKPLQLQKVTGAKENSVAGGWYANIGK